MAASKQPVPTLCGVQVRFSSVKFPSETGKLLLARGELGVDGAERAAGFALAVFGLGQGLLQLLALGAEVGLHHLSGCLLLQGCLLHSSNLPKQGLGSLAHDTT